MCKWKLVLYSAVFSVCVAALGAPAHAATLTAAQIADKNVEARGGLQAWRAVQTVRFEGKLGAGGNQRATATILPDDTGHRGGQSVVPPRLKEEAQLPFVMEMKRPHKTRLELVFAGQTALQVFDGSNGWKLRPFLNRRVVEPYTPEEKAKSADSEDLDGYLVDYASKGTRLELMGTEKVEGRDTYKLQLTLKSGRVTHMWIDAETFLETKEDGIPRVMDGVEHQVEVYMRDYREVSGLRMPFLIETHVLPLGKAAGTPRETPVPPEKMVIDRAAINPKLEDALFTRPDLQTKVAKN